MSMKTGTILGIIYLITLVSYIGYNEFETQTALAALLSEPDHHFIFAKSFQDYLNDNEIPFAASFPADLVIRDWSTIPINVQNGIRAQANLAGYTEFVP